MHRDEDLENKGEIAARGGGSGNRTTPGGKKADKLAIIRTCVAGYVAVAALVVGLAAVRPDHMSDIRPYLYAVIGLPFASIVAYVIPKVASIIKG
jgi:hypothetical protein